MKVAIKTVLFLCTGNYYRSRFAEELFNARAPDIIPDWRAASRALAIEMGSSNRGPISLHALAGLAERNIFPLEPYRNPLQCTEDDLDLADHIVALQKSEHLPLLAQRFPHMSDCVEYWNVQDIDQETPEQALGEITRNVEILIDRLSQAASSPS